MNNSMPDGKSMEERMFNMEKRMEETMSILQRMSEQVTELVMHARKTPNQMSVARSSRLKGHGGVIVSPTNAMGSQKMPRFTSAPSGPQTIEITIDHDAKAGELRVALFLNGYVHLCNTNYFFVVCPFFLYIYLFFSHNPKGSSRTFSKEAHHRERKKSDPKHRGGGKYYLYAWCPPSLIGHQ